MVQLKQKQIDQMRDSWITTIKLDKSDKKAVYMQIADEIIKSINLIDQR